MSLLLKLYHLCFLNNPEESKVLMLKVVTVKQKLRLKLLNMMGFKKSNWKKLILIVKESDEYQAQFLDQKCMKETCIFVNLQCF